MHKPLRKPPKIKFLEAEGALGDGRVKLIHDEPSLKRAIITSSTGVKRYHVAIALENGIVRAYSDDNGTRLRGYVGYPILSLMIISGLLPRDERVEEALKGIPWKKLNEYYKKYSLVIEEVKKIAEERGYNPIILDDYMVKGLKTLSRLKVYYDPEIANLELEDFL